MKNLFKTELVKHKGCEGCHKKCLFNGKVAHPDKAEESIREKFNCNSSKR